MGSCLWCSPWPQKGSGVQFAGLCGFGGAFGATVAAFGPKKGWSCPAPYHVRGGGGGVLAQEGVVVRWLRKLSKIVSSESHWGSPWALGRSASVEDDHV